MSSKENKKNTKEFLSGKNILFPCFFGFSSSFVNTEKNKETISSFFRKGSWESVKPACFCSFIFRKLKSRLERKILRNTKNKAIEQIRAKQIERVFDKNSEKIIFNRIKEIIEHKKLSIIIAK